MEPDSVAVGLLPGLKFKATWRNLEQDLSEFLTSRTLPSFLNPITKIIEDFLLFFRSINWPWYHRCILPVQALRAVLLSCQGIVWCLPWQRYQNTPLSNQAWCFPRLQRYESNFDWFMEHRPWRKQSICPVCGNLFSFKRVMILITVKTPSKHFLNLFVWFCAF